MLVKITNTSLLAAVTLATSSNIGASAGMLRKTPDLAENGAVFKKDDEDAGVLDDVFTDPKKKQDPVVAIGSTNNANSKAATTTVTLSKDSNVVTTTVHPNDDEAKKDNQDIHVLIDDVFTNTKNKATIANAGSKKATTTITKDSVGMKKKEEMSNVEDKAKKDVQDSVVPGNAKAGVVMKDGRRAAVASQVDIDIEAEEMMTADSKGTDMVEKVESDIAEDKVKKDVQNSPVPSKDKLFGTTVSHWGTTNHARTKEESKDGTLKDLNSMKEVESDVVPSVMAKEDVREKSGTDLSDFSDHESNVGKDDSIMPNMVEQDSGIIPRSLHDDSPPAKMNLRRIYDPFHAKNAHKFSDDQLYRMLASCNGTGACMNSPNSCVKDGSCTQSGSCSNSPYLLVEEDACSGPFACSNSSSLAVGMGSCTGGNLDEDDYYSCFRSPNGCIGQRSCLGQRGGACRFSSGIIVGDDSCLDGKACNGSSDATIKQSSCEGVSACASSPNITVDKYSCRDVRACQDSPGATIGKYACNCPLCCRRLNESCTIPDFQCNDDSVLNGDCSFPPGNPGCPDFSDLN